MSQITKASELGEFVALGRSDYPGHYRCEVLGVKSIYRDVTCEPHAFASMIGKIALAWSYATRTIELVRDHSGLANAIIGKTNDIGRWVGTSNGELTVYPQLLHLIAEHPDKKTGLLLVYVKLFANYPTPEYCVVIGKMK